MELKKYFAGKLRIAGFIFSLVGCFILFVFIFGSFFESQLLFLERIIQTSIFKWILRIIVLSLVIFLIKGKDFIDKIISKHEWINIFLKVIFITGIIGWGLWALSLFKFIDI